MAFDAGVLGGDGFGECGHPVQESDAEEQQQGDAEPRERGTQIGKGVGALYYLVQDDMASASVGARAAEVLNRSRPDFMQAAALLDALEEVADQQDSWLLKQLPGYEAAWMSEVPDAHPDAGGSFGAPDMPGGYHASALDPQGSAASPAPEGSPARHSTVGPDTLAARDDADDADDADDSESDADETWFDAKSDPEPEPPPTRRVDETWCDSKSRPRTGHGHGRDMVRRQVRTRRGVRTIESLERGPASRRTGVIARGWSTPWR